MDKKKCPITRKTFREKAPKGLKVQIGDIPMVASLKEFSTGSLGWNLSGKTVVEIDGEPCNVQIGLNLTLVGSKELPKDKGK
jgi:hypothetical protein